MFDKLEGIKKEYRSLNNELIKIETVKDLEKTKKLAQRITKLEDIVSVYDEYYKTEEDIKQTRKLLKDKEFVEMAEEELIRLGAKNKELEKRLRMMLMPKDKNDSKNAILEIRGAAGGNEANLFARDLYEMYVRYLTDMGWKHEIINSIPCESGGYSQIEIIIKGRDVYSRLKYESGSHRVQRVPKTESQGRIHTSTATVIVMPEQDDIEIEIKEQDLKIDVYRSGGAGGQSVNTTDSAVRITHLPTNIVVTCQNERSQIKNKEKALKVLKNKIYEETILKKEQDLKQERRIKIGTGDRSEKIRTYNYPQNRVTDHRINVTSKNLDRVMAGKLNDIIETLIAEDIKRKLEE